MAHELKDAPMVSSYASVDEYHMYKNVARILLEHLKGMNLSFVFVPTELILKVSY